MEKPGSWFLLVKCLKNTCGRVTFYSNVKCHSSTGVFHKHFASKIQLPGFYINETLVESGLNMTRDLQISLLIRSVFQRIN